MPAPDTLDVVGVNRAARERRVGVLQAERLVQPVGVDRKLDVVPIGDVQRAADLLGPGADILVDLESGTPAGERVLDRLRAATTIRAPASPG